MKLYTDIQDIHNETGSKWSLLHLQCLLCSVCDTYDERRQVRNVNRFIQWWQQLASQFAHSIQKVFQPTLSLLHASFNCLPALLQTEGHSTQITMRLGIMAPNHPKPPHQFLNKGSFSEDSKHTTINANTQAGLKQVLCSFFFFFFYCQAKQLTPPSSVTAERAGPMLASTSPVSTNGSL